MEEKLFTLIRKYGNDNFSKMDKTTLNRIMRELDNFYLELRTHISIPNLTFGVEIELENAHKIEIRDEIIDKDLVHWKITRDGSLDVTGCEIISPILTDSYDSFKELKEVCNIAAKNAEVGENCGGHIHIGAQILGTEKDNWINFAGLWSVYENIFFRFLYGEYLTPRTSIEKYARPHSPELFTKYLYLIDEFDRDLPFRFLIYKFSLNRNTAINFNHVDKYNSHQYKDSNTIEFRSPNSSLDAIVWQNNINLVSHALMYSTNKDFDRYLIEARGKAINRYNLRKYNEIDLDEALEVCDLIFDRNIDKLYFLRQYLKSYQTSNKPLTKAKKFTK